MAEEEKDKHVVKRKGHEEEFDDRKIYGSVYNASLNAHYNEETAESMAEDVVAELNEWIEGREEVTSGEIRKKVKKVLEDMDEDVALLYDTFMELC